MNAAVYSRYSSESQSEKSIDDQIRVCQNYARENSMVIDQKHIFVDEAVSGSLFARPGLQSLERAAENMEVEAVIVDDLSRLSRSNYQMLTLILKFNYLRVRIISVSDGINTEDENSKLGIQLRGLINELYLDDLRKKTARGLEGQKLRGFSAGEKVYGYATRPSGELKFNRRGRKCCEGMVHEICPPEALIVQRIFKDFTAGHSIKKIAIHLNRENVPTKKSLGGKWNASTISRFLKNEKYIGVWDWRKSKTVLDPMTGRKRSFPRPTKERVPLYREDLIIIDKATWDKTQARHREMEGVWPVSKKSKHRCIQKSYVHTNPTHPFSGLMRCGVCSGSIVLVSGKGSGYYGCLNARRSACVNTLIIPRMRLETLILGSLRKDFLTEDKLEQSYKEIGVIAASNQHALPALLEQRELELSRLNEEIQHYLSFIKVGNSSKAVAHAIKEVETRVVKLRAEIESLKSRIKNYFKMPSRQWIRDRLERLHQTLGGSTIDTARALKELMGTIILEPNKGKDQGDCKPHYLAHAKIRSSALLDKDQVGSNSYPIQKHEESASDIPATFCLASRL